MKKLITCFMALALLSSAACSTNTQGVQSNGDSPTDATSIEQAEYQKITAEEAKERIDAGGVVILDVRTQEEYDQGHIDGAIRLEANDFEEEAGTLLPDKDAEILIYCRSGNRSRTASEILLSMGYTKVYDFGGIIDWPYETVTASA